MPKRKSECINETTKNELTEAVKNTKLISLTAKILSEVINENSSFILNSTPLNQSKYHFHSKTQAKISIKSYLERILRFTHCEESSLIMALIYIDKLCEVNNFILTYANIHRIILISIVIATKFNEDECYTKTFAVDDTLSRSYILFSIPNSLLIFFNIKSISSLLDSFSSLFPSFM